MSNRVAIVNCSPYGGRLWPWVTPHEAGWRWIADTCDQDWNWHFICATPNNWLERAVVRPEIARYRACWQAAKMLVEEMGILVTHGPLMTCWTELARSQLGRRRIPHVAFSFNFTELPKNPVTLGAMKRAFRSVDAFFVYSNFERAVYSEFFGIPPSRLHMIHWGSQPPRLTGVPKSDEPFITAIGGQGRDYELLAQAMQRLPHIPLRLIGSPASVAGIEFPPNVTVQCSLPMEQVHLTLAASRFLVLPLRNTTVPCGHVTVVSAMQLAKPTIATRCPGIADYVIEGKTGVLCDPHSAFDLAAKIDSLWKCPKLVKHLGHSASQFAAWNCSERNVVRAFESMVCQLLGLESPTDGNEPTSDPDWTPSLAATSPTCSSRGGPK